MSAIYQEGDRVRSPLFTGVGTIAEVAEGNRGRMRAVVRLDEKSRKGTPADTATVMFADLRPAELPGYDLPFTPAAGNLAWITPALVRDVRSDPRIGIDIQDKFDEALIEAREDPDGWMEVIGEMGHLPAWVAIIRRVAAEKGLL